MIKDGAQTLTLTLTEMPYVSAYNRKDLSFRMRYLTGLKTVTGKSYPLSKGKILKKSNKIVLMIERNKSIVCYLCERRRQNHAYIRGAVANFFIPYYNFHINREKNCKIQQIDRRTEL